MQDLHPANARRSKRVCLNSRPSITGAVVGKGGVRVVGINVCPTNEGLMNPRGDLSRHGVPRVYLGKSAFDVLM